MTVSIPNLRNVNEGEIVEVCAGLSDVIGATFIEINITLLTSISSLGMATFNTCTAC